MSKNPDGRRAEVYVVSEGDGLPTRCQRRLLGAGTDGRPGGMAG